MYYNILERDSRQCASSFVTGGLVYRKKFVEAEVVSISKKHKCYFCSLFWHNEPQSMWGQRTTFYLLFVKIGLIELFCVVFKRAKTVLNTCQDNNIGCWCHTSNNFTKFNGLQKLCIWTSLDYILNYSKICLESNFYLAF